MRRAIEAEGILLLFGETGEGVGIARQSVGDDAPALIFDQRGESAGVLRRTGRRRSI
jgi:hypothetical protein